MAFKESDEQTNFYTVHFLSPQEYVIVGVQAQYVIKYANNHIIFHHPRFNILEISCSYEFSLFSTHKK